ncbi:MAG TPA: hypothetical protein VH087_07720 [Thermoanaerobaculia bacterium]|jgi:hypothetical protein|nr:hypothetical protein [Thermoanaerobaculia bacterium]
MDAALAKKLKLTGRKKPVVIDAPAGYDVPGAAAKLSGKFDFVQLFVKSEAELAKVAPKAVAALEPDAILWVSFPKGSSKIQTDLTRDKGWDSLRKFPLKWITLISVNDTWSAFALGPLKKGEEPNW